MALLPTCPQEWLQQGRCPASVTQRPAEGGGTTILGAPTCLRVLMPVPAATWLSQEKSATKSAPFLSLNLSPLIKGVSFFGIKFKSAFNQLIR